MTAFFESGDTGAVLGAKLRQDASFGKMGGEEDCTGRFVLFPPETGIDTALFTGFTAVRQAERCSRSTRYVNNMQYDRAKGENSMRIAVTYEDGQVFQHFGHTREFKVYDVEDGEVRSAQVAETERWRFDLRRHWRRRSGGPGGGGHSDLWRRLRRRGRGGGVVPGRDAGL